MKSFMRVWRQVLPRRYVEGSLGLRQGCRIAAVPSMRRQN